MSKEEVSDYFRKSTEKVSVETESGTEPFEKFLSHRYNNISFYYATFALMGLKSDDVLVTGSVLGAKHHVWVEFKFEENEYVFDPMNVELMQKQIWDELFNPIVKTRTTQKQILDLYLNDAHAFKITDTSWKFSYHLPFELNAAQIEIDNLTSQISKFTGCFIPPDSF